MRCASGNPLVFVPFDAEGKCPVGSAVLLTQPEYDAISIAPVLNSIFKMPASEELGHAFAAGFTIPMTLTLVSWACASLVNFWREKRE